MHAAIGKPFSALSKHQQRRRKATLKSSLTKCLNSCQAANGLKLVSVMLKTEKLTWNMFQKKRKT